MIGQTIQGVEGGWSAVGPAGAVDRAGFLIQKAGDKAVVLVGGTDTAGARE